MLPRLVGNDRSGLILVRVYQAMTMPLKTHIQHFYTLIQPDIILDGDLGGGKDICEQ